MLPENQFTKNLDLGLIFVVLLLVVIGIMSIYSATYISEASIGHLKFHKQILWSVLGLAVFATAVFIPLRMLYKYAYLLYGFSILLLLLVLVIGSGAGTHRWFIFGSFRIQPSEFAKIGAVLALSRFLSKENRDLNQFRELTVAFSICFVPLLLIIRQPDLGSALVFLAISLPMLHWGGLSPVVLFILIAPLISLLSAFSYYSFFVAMILISLILFACQRGTVFFLINFLINIGVGIITPILWGTLKDYQQNRILTFLGLVTDPHGLGYQVIQSKVAIGSGGLWGKGFLDGTQTHLRFLPEQHTDFIFCVIGEEFGFIGVFFVLILFLYIVFKGLRIASIVKSKFTSLLVFGGTIILLFQIFVNIGMTVGIMPVTGLPLPFLSYGGSSLISNLFVIGLIINASRRRFDYIKSI